MPPKSLPEDVKKEDFENQLRGVVINVDHSPIYRKVITASTLLLLTIVGGSWGYFYLIRSEEDKLKERLSYYQSLGVMYKEASLAIRATESSGPMIKKGVVDLIHVANTNLRLANQVLSPYIPEKYFAVIDILEGLCRLVIEQKIDLNQLEDLHFYEEALSQVGNIYVEYYENGGIQRIPLIKQSALRKEMQNIKKEGIENSIRLQQIKNELETEIKKTSFTIAAPAVLLGKWYRYHNDIVNASRCFEIARKYVDGYKQRNIDYKGKRPEKMGPLWREYVQALEYLSEFSYREENYRKARSYLFRIFNTPSTSLVNVGKNQNQVGQIDQQVLDLQRDLDVLNAAIANPLRIQDFPFFAENTDIILWDNFINIIKKNRDETKDTIQNLLWKGLSSNIRETLLEAQSKDSLSYAVKQAIIDSLNKLIKDPSLFRITVYSIESLSLRSRNLLTMAQERTLSIEESYFINRDIIQAELESALEAPWRLSNGLFISNQLNEEQIKILIRYYREEINTPNITPFRKEELLRKIALIQNGTVKSNFNDFYNQLNNRLSFYKEFSQKSESVFDTQRLLLEQIKKTTQELESKGKSDPTEIQKLATEYNLLKYKQEKAYLEKKEADKSIAIISQEIDKLTLPLEEHKKYLEEHYAELKVYQKSMAQKQIAQSGNITQRLYQQMNFRKKYLNLLHILRSQDQITHINSLIVEKEILDGRISLLREQYEVAIEEEKKSIERRIFELQSQQNNFIQKLEDIYAPLRKVMDDITVEEKKIWEVEDQLKKTQNRILELIGTEYEPGSLKKLTQARDELLLLPTAEVISKPEISEQISDINGRIETQQKEFEELLQLESFYNSVLETFFPSRNAKRVISKSAFKQLKEELDRQKQFIERYKHLRKYNDLQVESHKQYQEIIDNFSSLSQEIGNYSLDEEKTDKLSRYIQNIIKNRNVLTRIKQKKSSLEAITNESEPVDIESRGFYADRLDMFQIENEMNIHITEYRRIFEHRKTVLKEIHRCISQKNELDRQRIKAINSKDQIQIESLSSEIQTLSDLLKEETQKIVKINNQLRQLSEEYNSKFQKVQEYQKNLQPKIKELQQEIDTFYQNIHLKSLEAEDVVSHTLQSTENIYKIKELCGLAVEDVMDNLIKEQQEEVKRLENIYELSLLENFYKARAIWLLAKNFQKQSTLSTYSQLLVSNKIQPDLLEDEYRIVRPLFDEFNVDWVYSNALFGNESQSIDNNQANYLTWVDFLERSAINLYQQELPKYTISYTEKSASQILSFDEAQDNLYFIAYSNYLSGKIYMQRSLRCIQSSTLTPEKNQQIKEELNLAASAFGQFIDFAEPFSYNTENSSITAPQESSQEFPLQTRYPIEEIYESRLFLGIISDLKGDHEVAIKHYEDLIKRAMVLNKINPINHPEWPIGQIEPANFEDYQYDAHVSEQYIGLVAKRPSLIESLYRLGKSYQHLAEEHYTKSLRENEVPLAVEKGDINTNSKLFKEHAHKAIAYYSQLILSHPFSEYRQAALLYRAKMLKMMGNYSQARQDLINCLANAPFMEQPMDWANANLKGDLLGEINPSYAYVSFELGKLCLDNEDYAAAADAFLDSTKKTLSNENLVKAKIAYTDALIGSKEWLKANVFLKDLAKEMYAQRKGRHHIYPSDIILNLGITNKELFHFDEAKKNLISVFENAPMTLLNEDGLLDLSNLQAIDLLENEFRDEIRPIALACLHLAEITLMEKDYTSAKQFYQQAEKLFRILPWSYDRVLRLLNRSQFQVYKDKYITLARWGQIKTDISELLFSSFAQFRKDAVIDPIYGMSDRVAHLLRLVDQNINVRVEDKNLYENMLARCDQFYNRLAKQLPEYEKKEKIIRIRQEMRAKGHPQIKIYDALMRLNQFLTNKSDQTILSLLNQLQENFPENSLEGEALNRFILNFIGSLGLTEVDRAQMKTSNSDVQNLSLIINSAERLVNFYPELMLWLENELRRTELDDLFIPVSEQSAILEEVDLYRVSLLSSLNTQGHYKNLCKIADRYMTVNSSYPNRLIHSEIYCQILEIAAILAEDNQDWSYVEKYNRELLNGTNQLYFIQEDRSDLYRSQFGLAQALVNLSNDNKNQAMQITDRTEKSKFEALIQGQVNEAKEILTRFVQNKAKDSISTIRRIKAQQLLSNL